jgi:hypothetical protein
LVEVAKPLRDTLGRKLPFSENMENFNNKFYMLQVEVGSNYQELNLLVDTGSNVSLFHID